VAGHAGADLEFQHARGVVLVLDEAVAAGRGDGDLAAVGADVARALEHGPRPIEVSTDRAPAYPRVLDELLPAACHVTEQYANNH